MLWQKCGIKQIAAHLNVNRSTIYREIKHNQRSSKDFRYTGNYDSHFAQKRYLKRRQRLSKLEKDCVLREVVHKQLKAGWSPWQIEWYLKLSQMLICLDIQQKSITVNL